MNHPAWYMKPVHVMLRLSGVERICLGSSGNSGKEALANVVGFLKQGYSTVLASDGPTGPLHELKPGVLLMSRDAQLPIIALRFVCSNYLRAGRWDRKFIPLPFSAICVEAAEPLIVQNESMISAEKTIVDWLNFEKE